MEVTKKQIWRQRIGLYGGVILMLVICWVFIWAYRTITIRRYGAELSPKKQVAVQVQAPFYGMNDEAYASLSMGETGFTIEEQGSLLCALSMAAGAAGVEISPTELNEPSMYDGNVYQVKKIGELDGLEGARFEAYTSFAEDKVRRILRNGEVCLARVQRGGSVHWLCIVGTQKDHFVVLDPAGNGETALLTERTYALGRLRLDENGK